MNQYIEWIENHCDSPECDANYDGPSGGMEADCAIVLWQRSEKHHMQYTTFVSDGDSSAFKAVTKLRQGQGPYGEVNIVKVECVNNVAKRLGTGLRNIKTLNIGDVDSDEQPKKKQRSGMRGKDKLTNMVIDHLQYYFPVSLSRKVGTSAVEMRNEIISSFYHCSSTDEKPHHDLCTNGTESWCFYNRAKARGEVQASYKKMQVYFRNLTAHQLEAIKGIYDPLTTDEMMNRFLRGMTQDRNESLHAKIWKICPKHKNATVMIVNFATATAVAHYNAGHEESNLCNIFGVPTPSSLKKYLQQKDVIMNIPYKRKTKNKRMRKDLGDYAVGGF